MMRMGEWYPTTHDTLNIYLLTYVERLFIVRHFASISTATIWRGIAVSSPTYSQHKGTGFKFRQRSIHTRARLNCFRQISPAPC